MSEEEKPEEVIADQPVDEPAVPSSEEAAPEVEQPSEEPAGEGEEVPKEAAAYQPNLNFRANNKEQQFDDWMASAITDADKESRVRELYEKAYGLDEIKPRAEATLKEYNDYKGHAQPMLDAIEELKQNVANKDFDAFFRNTNIPPEWIYKHVQDKINYQQLSQEEKAQQDNYLEANRRSSNLETENAQYQAQAESAMLSQRTQELDYELAKPEVNQVMQTFDQRMGRVGAFRDEVITRGQTAHANGTGRDISAQEAVNGVLALMGNTAAPQALVPSPTVGATQQSKPVIPHIKGRGTSPVRKAAMSFDDLRAKGRAME
jgi:hypothetical protein